MQDIGDDQLLNKMVYVKEYDLIVITDYIIDRDSEKTILHVIGTFDFHNEKRIIIVILGECFVNTFHKKLKVFKCYSTKYKFCYISFDCLQNLYYPLCRA